MSILTKLKLANASRKPVEETPEERMRNRMVAHLTEQLEMATALAEGRAVIAHRVGEMACAGSVDMSQPMHEAADPLSPE
ncbi:MAG TPA: hypothetical protein VK196_10210 [Magnetospirillum sp.]|nr:hypothetical protein [Magnetospirillum sp.]